MSYSQPLCLIIFFLSSFPITRATALASNTVTNSTKCFNRTSGSTGNQIEKTICATMVTTDSKIWTGLESDDHCIKTGGHLITIASAAENQLIQSLVEQNYCWIGLINDGCLVKTRMKDWKWINRDDSSYRNWDIDQPDYLYECCTGMWHSNGKWNNDQCDTKLNCFICELVSSIDPVKTTTTLPGTTTRTMSITAVTSSTQPTTEAMTTTATLFAIHSLVSNGGDIALIILASVFFLTIIGLSVVIFILKRKQIDKPPRTMKHESVIGGTPTGVSNDAYGITAPKDNVEAMYYDTQNEAVESLSHKNELGNERTEDANTDASENQFANNEVYA